MTTRREPEVVYIQENGTVVEKHRCPTCRTIFTPTRRDNIYDQPNCRKTAHYRTNARPDRRPSARYRTPNAPNTP